ncbi:MAG: yciB [Gammaproteobacteria bacterium]|jgi:intracellular septation protein|nr:yciB [Gammaproteobacteria bacterium]
MLNLLYDFFVVLVFFVTFKFYGIYAATAAGIGSSVLQVAVTRVFRKKYDKKQLMVTAIFLVFGGMTLYFHDPIFVKWKPTILFWIFGFAFIISQFIGKQSLTQRMMGHIVEEKKSVPNIVWRRLNLAWSLFFFSLGAINIFVVYHFTTEVWVNFKLYGIFTAMLLFGLVQAFFLTRYLTK